jgi:hypothetical protein
MDQNTNATPPSTEPGPEPPKPPMPLPELPQLAEKLEKWRTDYFELINRQGQSSGTGGRQPGDGEGKIV